MTSIFFGCNEFKCFIFFIFLKCVVIVLPSLSRYLSLFVATLQFITARSVNDVIVKSEYLHSG